tara:strand:+ start:532 stop:924 length:393 start_codon:yes stop_codon:yes gene_type:complete
MENKPKIFQKYVYIKDSEIKTKDLENYYYSNSPIREEKKFKAEVRNGEKNDYVVDFGVNLKMFDESKDFCFVEFNITVRGHYLVNSKDKKEVEELVNQYAIEDLYKYLVFYIKHSCHFLNLVPPKITLKD